ncbi:hypothetical protein [Actinomyces massiliensis]|uniref:hypothetical protein n=1 Tax=Actinomyces massiliensis TaxID=461393 RepID=UPI0002DE68BC|nr:hypothetical protein [Actinomyces massiliensis]
MIHLIHPDSAPALLPAAGPERPGLPGHRRAWLSAGWRQERGDVPGWVLVTLMTAGLVVSLWAVAGPALTQVFNDAIAKVTGAI